VLRGEILQNTPKPAGVSGPRESKQQFLQRNGAGPGRPIPTKGSLLFDLVGDPFF